MPDGLRRLAVFAPNWLGDAVMMLPALGDVRRHAPAATLVVAARAALAPIFTLVPGVDGVLALEGRGGAGDLARVGRDARRVREGAFDAAVFFPNSFQSAWVARQAGIPERWGYRADWRGGLLTRAVARPRGRLHQAEYYQRLTRALGMVNGPLVASIPVPAAEAERGAALLRAKGWAGEPLVGLAPGAAYGSAKRYPPDMLGEAAAAIAARHGLRPVVVGTARDHQSARHVLRTSERQCREARGGSPARAAIDLTGATDLGLLAGVLAHCAAFVSNDSGAMHLAAAVGLPVIAIFGPTDEGATAPLPHPNGQRPVILTHGTWCRPCLLRACPLDHGCMTGVAPDRVVAAVAGAVGQATVGPPEA